jgi:hypothetical protein
VFLQGLFEEQASSLMSCSKTSVFEQQPLKMVIQQAAGLLNGSIINPNNMDTLKIHNFYI